MEAVLNNSELEITVKGVNAAPAADAGALGLMAAGATVDFPSRTHGIACDGRALRGRRATVRLVPASSGPGTVETWQAGVGLASVAKLGVGAVLMLMLFGAEVRLHFGPRLDTLATLVGIWAFWRLCLRSAPFGRRRA